jgi:hypothetical protein
VDEASIASRGEVACLSDIIDQVVEDVALDVVANQVRTTHIAHINRLILLLQPVLMSVITVFLLAVQLIELMKLYQLADGVTAL